MKFLNWKHIASAFAVWTLVTIGVGSQTVARAETPVTDTSAVGELAYWNKIKTSSDLADFKTYITTFPQGMFHELAVAKYVEMGGSQADLQGLATEPAAKIEVVTEEPPATIVKPVVKRVVKKKVAVVETYVEPPKRVYRPVKRKASLWKPPVSYKKIRKIKLAVDHKATIKRPKYAAATVYVKKAKRPTYKPAYKVVKAKYAAVRPKKKPAYKPISPEAEGGGGGGGDGGGGGSW